MIISVWVVSIDFDRSNYQNLNFVNIVFEKICFYEIVN